MPCNKCNKKSCNGCESNTIAKLQNQIDDLQSSLENLFENTKVFLQGHPILLIEDADDIAKFDLTTGKGFDTWDKYAVCDGKTHINPKTKKPYTTPNFTDRFIVQARGQYEVGDVGGSDTVTLTVDEMPVHNHDITDEGHIHQINDPGHIHAINDDGHVHQVQNEPHHHAASLAMGAHTHNVTDHYQDDATLGFIAAGPTGTQGYLNSSTPGEVTIASASETYDTETTDGGTGGIASGYTDDASVVITTDNAATGIEIVTNETGIDQTENAVTGISVNNKGGGQAHENRPPYFAALYVVKLY